MVEAEAKTVVAPATPEVPEVAAPAVVRKKWVPKAAVVPAGESVSAADPVPDGAMEKNDEAPVRKKWEPKRSAKPPDAGD